MVESSKQDDSFHSSTSDNATAGDSIMVPNISLETNSQVDKSIDETGLVKPTRPVRTRHLPQHLKDYQVYLPKARTSSHTVAQVFT
ncbi:hypothetical protein V6N12_069991 [Hibiscus sabdariffa]|uniref:Uncharacterized protein n=1 Tax=Hibiscus sabdariffa TaxID=183260 RepID=A0ABR2FFH5_9ROSI